MKKSNLKMTVLLTTILAVLAVSVAAGQRGSHQSMGQGSHQGMMGQGMHQGMGQGEGMPMYDPDSEVTVAGTIEEVSERGGQMGMTGTHLVIKTDEETLDVHLGPSMYLADQGFVFNKGDQIQVTGSKVKQQNAIFLIAREVKKGDRLLPLRDAQGRPAWAEMGGTHQGGQGRGGH